MKAILDACSGSRMFWKNKNHPLATFMDKRELRDTLCDGRTLEIKPDIIADFKDMPFEDETFYLVIFDPPHLVRAGQSSWLAKKYGVLPKDWKSEIKAGFSECMRVLKPAGTLIFKWCDADISLKEILSLTPEKPVITHTAKSNSGFKNTYFCVFFKEAK